MNKGCPQHRLKHQKFTGLKAKVRNGIWLIPIHGNKTWVNKPVICVIQHLVKIIFSP